MMKKNVFSKNLKLTLATLTLSLCTAAYAEINFPIPNAPELDAESYILIDAKSGEVLATHQADQRRDPASLTKMMTSYVVGEAIKQNRISEHDIVTTSKDAWATGNPVLKGSSVMFLKPGDKVSVADLNRGVIIQSGNDASIAVAEHIAGSQDAFVNLMNNYAQQLGLTNTHFQTVHGLDAPGQYTTARDMAMLGKALITDLPNEYAIYKEKTFSYNGIKQDNRNGLLWDTSLNVDGIKTGHTNAAGYNLVASAVEGNTRLISAVLGGKTFKGRESESKKLLTWGFRFFETATPIKANKSLVTETLWYGKKSNIQLGSLENVYVTVPRSESANIEIKYTIADDYLSAPIQKGTQVGTMQFMLNDEVLAEKPLVTLETVEEAGFFGNIWDFIKLQFYKLFD